MTTRTRLTTAVGTACLLTLPLTACSNTSPEAGRPDAPPPTSAVTKTEAVTTPPTAPTEPSTTPPSRPEAAGDLSMSAAEAFLGHYVALLNFAYSTGDTAPLLAASDKGCVGCQGTADYLTKVNARNGGFTGDYADRLVEVKEIFKGASGRVGGSLTVRTGDYVERNPPTASPVQKKARVETWQFTLNAVGGVWVMYEVEVGE